MPSPEKNTPLGFFFRKPTFPATIGFLFFVSMFARLYHNAGFDRLPPLLMWNTYHRDFKNLGVTCQHAFHLFGIDIIATTLNHVFPSPHDIQIALFIERADLTSM